MSTSSPPRHRFPLSDSTSDLNAPQPSSTYHTAKSRLHRLASYRELHPDVDSSESEFSLQCSVYEAQVYRSGSETSSAEERKERFQWQHDAPLPAAELTWDDNREGTVTPTGEWDDSHAPDHQPRIPNPASTSVQRSPPGTPSRRAWALPNLETITEQRSHATLRPTHSFPGLINNSTAKANSSTASPKPSAVCGIELAIIPVPPPRSSSVSPSKSRRRNSISLDDLSLQSFKATLRAPLCSASSSEDDKGPAAQKIQVTYPAVPPHPPPTRTPTPPGLPSFGSREALRYQPHHMIATPDPTSTTPPQSDRGFLAFLGRVFSPSTQYPHALSAPTSVGLPPGVIARAADGTMVRGRFGVRQSGHMGMSGTTVALERHPWHRDMPLAQVRSGVDGSEADRTRVVRFSEEVQVANIVNGDKRRKKNWGRKKKGKKAAAQALAAETRDADQPTFEVSGALPFTNRTPSGNPPQSILRTSTERPDPQSRDQNRPASPPNSSIVTVPQANNPSNDTAEPIRPSDSTWFQRLQNWFHGSDRAQNPTITERSLENTNSNPSNADPAQPSDREHGRRHERRLQEEESREFVPEDLDMERNSRYPPPSGADIDAPTREFVANPNVNANKPPPPLPLPPIQSRWEKWGDMCCPPFCCCCVRCPDSNGYSSTSASAGLTIAAMF